MRLIGSLSNSQEAFTFQKYCKSKGIDLLVDNPSEKQGVKIQVWVINEDDTENAMALLEKFQENPESPEFYVLDQEDVEKILQPEDKEPEIKTARLPVLTWFWVALSVLIYFMQLGQTNDLVTKQGTMGLQAMLTPIEQSLFFDVPDGLDKLEAFLSENNIKTEADFKALSPELKQKWESLKEVSYFHGYLGLFEDEDYKKAFENESMPTFAKIKQGQLYRLVTPIFLHGSILHILFNMLWLFVLMKQIEMKIGAIRTLLLACVVAVISNLSQYLVSGPFFVGASGVVVGLAGFIWGRIRLYPWEGYLLSKTVVFFLMLYVLVLVLLSIGVFIFNVSSHKDLTFGIANTAHVVGGLAGFMLSRLKFFRRK